MTEYQKELIWIKALAMDVDSNIEAIKIEAQYEYENIACQGGGC